MAWKVFQFTIFVSVLFANVYYGWTDSQYAAIAIGIFAAIMATAVLTQLHLSFTSLLDRIYWKLYR